MLNAAAPVVLDQHTVRALVAVPVRDRALCLPALQGGGALPFKTAQDELREIEEREQAEADARQAPAAAAAGAAQQLQAQHQAGDAAPARRQDGAAPPADGQQEDEAAEGADGDHGGFVDPTAGMNPRQKKLWELQQRMKAARKANETAVVVEKRKQAAAKADTVGGDERPAQGSKRKWHEEKQKKRVGATPGRVQAWARGGAGRRGYGASPLQEVPAAAACALHSCCGVTGAAFFSPG